MDDIKADPTRPFHAPSTKELARSGNQLIWLKSLASVAKIAICAYFAALS